MSIDDDLALFDDGPGAEFMSKRLIGKELPAPSNPMAVARSLIRDTKKPLKYWRGDIYERQETHWQRIDSGQVRHWLYHETEAATYIAPGGKDGPERKSWLPNKAKIADLMDALCTIIRHDGDEERGIFTQNGRVFGFRMLGDHDPKVFNLNSLPFHFDQTARCPNLLALLDSSLPHDKSAHAFLQEWFGYVVSGRTDLDAMACLIGETRSGKSLIARVLEALVGENGHVGVSLEDIADKFGLGALIGKSLAVISEPDWRNGQKATQPILRITGGDPVRIDRKYDREGWYGTIGARLMVISNDTPRLPNASGALAARMVNVRFTESFVGREDRELKTKLLAELPGILNWALEGLKRLEFTGRFTLPESHKDLEAEFKDYADPYGLFLTEAGAMHPNAWCTREQLYEAWRAWCKRVGNTRDSTNAVALINKLGSRKGLTKKRVNRNTEWHLIGFCPDDYVFDDVKGDRVQVRLPIAQRPGEGSAEPLDLFD